MSRAWPVEGVRADRPLGDMARRILSVRVAEVYSYRPIVQRPEAVEATHALRIALKRLRYTLELFASVFGEAGARQIDRVKALQETLGNLHDLDVRLDLIHAVAEATTRKASGKAAGQRSGDGDEAVGAGLVRYADRERASRRALHRDFVAQWNAFQQAGMRQELVTLSQSTPGRTSE